MATANEGIGYLPISVDSQVQIGQTLARLIVVGAMAMLRYQVFTMLAKHTTG